MPDPSEAPTATPTATPNPTDPPASTTPETDAPEIDASGLKRALDAERKARRDLERQAKERQTELDRLREATASDAEKALIAARKEEREKADAEWQARLDKAEAEKRNLLIESEIRTEAMKLNFIDIGDVVMALRNHDDITIDEQTGQVKGIGKALKALAEAKPHWVKADKAPAYGSPSTGRGGPANGRSPEEVEALRREQARRTRSFF